MQKSVWTGQFVVCGVPLTCHVLEDGSRIIEKQSMEAFFGWLEAGGMPPTEDPGCEDFARWMGGHDTVGKPRCIHPVWDDYLQEWRTCAWPRGQGLYGRYCKRHAKRIEEGRKA